MPRDFSDVASRLVQLLREFEVAALDEAVGDDIAANRRDAIASFLTAEFGEEWFGIESAPKDGTNILASDGKSVALVWWDEEWRDNGERGVAGQSDFAPTKWRHLPP